MVNRHMWNDTHATSQRTLNSNHQETLPPTCPIPWNDYQGSHKHWVLVRMERRGNHRLLLAGCRRLQAPVGTVRRFLEKINRTSDPTSGNVSEEIQNNSQSCTPPSVHGNITYDGRHREAAPVSVTDGASVMRRGTVHTQRTIARSQ